LTQVEEELLVCEYGDTYRDFQARVPRLLPCLHVTGHSTARTIDPAGQEPGIALSG